MKIIFETEDISEGKRILKAGDYYSALFEIYNISRNSLKHDTDKEEALERIKEIVCEVGVLDDD